MELNKKNIRVIALLVGGAILLYWGLQNLPTVTRWFGVLFGLLAPFIVGLCIAFILNVPMRAIERHLYPKSKKKLAVKLRRPLALVLALVAVLAVLMLVFFIVVPEIGRTFNTVRAGVPGFLARVQAWTNELMVKLPELTAGITFPKFDWNSITKNVLGFLQNGATSFVGSTISVATSVFSGLFNFALGLIFACYVLAQKEKLERQMKKLLYACLHKERADWIVSVCALANRTFSNFFTGQCLEAVILGCMFFVAMSIFRFPYAMMISVLIAFTALIPVFGAIVGMIVGALLILVVNPLQAFWFIVLFQVLQQIEGNFIYPRVVGNSVGLPAIWVLVAVTLGASMMGVVGMLIYVPLCSVFYALLRQAVNRRLEEKAAAAAPPAGEDPPPPEEAAE